jgi:hypothetical protein
MARSDDSLNRAGKELASYLPGLARRLSPALAVFSDKERDEIMRYVLTVLLLLLALLLTACSFGTSFFVINESGQPIEITYRIGETNIEPLVVTGKPAIVAASQLSSDEWRELSSTEYVFDQEKRTVTVSLPPGQALRITRGGEWREGNTGAYFIIKELDIKGASGEIILKGDRVYKSFTVVPKGFFQFGPPTLLTLTYK